MIILIRIDYQGNDLQNDLKKLNEIHAKIEKTTGGKVEGPYLPQQSTILVLFHVDKYERLNEAGRVWYAEMSRLKLPFVADTYEIAVNQKNSSDSSVLRSWKRLLPGEIPDVGHQGRLRQFNWQTPA